MTNPNALIAIADHDAYLIELADPSTTPERVEAITREAVATYDLMNYSAAMCDLNSQTMRDLDYINRQVHAALVARKEAA